MAKDNIVNYSVRLNLNNEQHIRVYHLLKDLNTSIHKSVNQFMIDSIDYYIKSLENEELTNQALKCKQEGQGYITKKDLLEVREELYSEVKEEILRIFGTVITGGKAFGSKKQEEIEEKIEKDAIMIDFATKWG